MSLLNNEHENVEIDIPFYILSITLHTQTKRTQIKSFFFFAFFSNKGKDFFCMYFNFFIDRYVDGWMDDSCSRGMGNELK